MKAENKNRPAGLIDPALPLNDAGTNNLDAPTAPAKKRSMSRPIIVVTNKIDQLLMTLSSNEERILVLGMVCGIHGVSVTRTVLEELQGQ